MGLLNIALAILLLLVLVHSEQSSASRVLNDHKEGLVKEEKLGLGFQSLPRGPVPPSGSSGCTYIPGSGGPNCPLGEKHYAGDHATGYPRHMVRLGVAASRD
ncbi:hypothetical protein L484_017428 [Morus notabilis]|uniref:Uncharacterized protein n=1 Tax=Morus notabilis TaxID=981085 RepID=W9R3U7_9ROSA|nr:hypothetical protein L484_017428 [Morus notabilis]